MGPIGRIAFNIYVATNMLVCAIVFAPWAAPRETISGLMGRWMATEQGWKMWTGLILGWVIDRVYFWEPNHCIETFAVEYDARQVLYL